MSIKVLGIDLANYSFSIHGVDHHGNPVLKRTVKRKKLLNEFTHLPPCLIGVESNRDFIQDHITQSIFQYDG